LTAVKASCGHGTTIPATHPVLSQEFAMRRLVALIALGIVTFAATAAGPRSGPPDDRADRYGWNLMTPDERTEHQQKMRGFTDYAACLTYVAEHHRLMDERAKAKGVTLPPMHEQACRRLKPAEQ